LRIDECPLANAQFKKRTAGPGWADFKFPILPVFNSFLSAGLAIKMLYTKARAAGAFPRLDASANAIGQQEVST